MRLDELPKVGSIWKSRSNPHLPSMLVISVEYVQESAGYRIWTRQIDSERLCVYALGPFLDYNMLWVDAPGPTGPTLPHPIRYILPPSALSPAPRAPRRAVTRFSVCRVCQFVDSRTTDIVEAWWSRVSPAERSRYAEDGITTWAVAELALNMPKERITRAMETELGKTLGQLGFDKKRPTRAGGSDRKRRYFPSEQLLLVPWIAQPVDIRLPPATRAVVRDTHEERRPVARPAPSARRPRVRKVAGRPLSNWTPDADLLDIRAAIWL